MPDTAKTSKPLDVSIDIWEHQNKQSQIDEEGPKGVDSIQQLRTYKVTRQQMKEIWMLTGSTSLKDIVLKYFDCFDEEVNISKEEVKWMVEYFISDEGQKLLKSIFPEYFFIPEGEPVLCKRCENDNWRIRVSDGKGGAYENGLLNGTSAIFKQIIPFAKNPPK